MNAAVLTSSRENSPAPFAIQRFLSVRFDRATLEQAASLLAARPGDAPFVYVVTPNVDHVCRLSSGPDTLWPLYEHAWISLCDSRVLQLAAKLFALDLPVAPGSDVVADLFTRWLRPDDAITVIGCKPATIDRLRAQFGLRRLNHHNPPMGFIDSPDEVDTCVRFVIEHPGRFVFLCLGSPQQEILAARLAACGTATGIGLCVGVALAFVAGEKKRAPVWMRRAGLEWVHRLVSEPKRLWRRYLMGCPTIIGLMVRARLFDSTARIHDSAEKAKATSR